MIPEQVEPVDDFTPFGVHAFTTTRQFGTFSSASEEPTRDVMARWDVVRSHAAAYGVRRLATAAQVHGARVLVHVDGWEGWLRELQGDGHFAARRDTAMAVSIADCVPVFLAHPSGAAAILHSGWRGSAARIVEQGIAAFTHRGFHASELHVHLGPAICGDCYEVSPDVIKKLTGDTVSKPRTVDLRALIADHARAAGVHRITVSSSCTRHHNSRFFSHRAGDVGRQISVLFAEPTELQSDLGRGTL